MSQNKILDETIIELRRRLSNLSPRSLERRILLQEVADIYGVSENTIYRALREQGGLKSAHRSDFGIPRIAEKPEMEQYCEIVAALKIRTTNLKGRHISTRESIRLLEDYGVTLSDELIKAPKGLLTKSTVNRYLKSWGYTADFLLRQPPAVRFQAEQSNDCWQFDLSPSDLKHLDVDWIDPERGRPVLMIYSIVDDRSGVCYQEYHNVYGEDTEAALRFLFKAMSKKDDPEFPLQGIPKMIYTDNGPIARSQLFNRVMDYLGITVQKHLPKGKDGRRVTARSKRKVERAFRTVKELHETLYHFNKPKDEEEANQWLFNFLFRYNGMTHRSEPHTRMEDWLQNLPSNGITEMCTWERYCSFARNPEKRKVGLDTRISVDGTFYEIAPELAGQEVIIWWGLFDYDLFVEFKDEKFGPYRPSGGVIPLHKYRAHKKSKYEKRADEIEDIAANIQIPSSALEHEFYLAALPSVKDKEVPKVKFSDPDPFDELTYPNSVFARQAIADFLNMPLALLSSDDLSYIKEILSKTLDKRVVMDKVEEYFSPHSVGKKDA